MTSREKINSIKSVINEFYHDMKCKGNLTECANECWKEYQQFCEDIKKNLEALEIIKKNTLIQKNGDGFTITVWFNTKNCDFKSCASMEEILKVRKVLKKLNFK